MFDRATDSRHAMIGEPAACGYDLRVPDAAATPPPCVPAMPDADTAWSAVLRRDRGFDGRFVTGVLTTGIYCRPSCAARHPARANVRFFADGAAARGAGLRACRRCLPDDIARDEVAVAQAVMLLAAEEPPALAALAAAVGYAPHHFHRLFKRATGLTPGQYRRMFQPVAHMAEAAAQPR